jgi:hypothetical protein
MPEVRARQLEGVDRQGKNRVSSQQFDQVASRHVPSSRERKRATVSENQLKRISLEKFKAQAKDLGDERVLIPKGYACEVKVEGGEDSRSLEFTISTAAVDRDDDTIDVAGWELANFQRAGVVLWAHDSRLPPIASPEKTWVEGAALRSIAKFAPADLDHPLGMGFGSTVLRMFREGLMKAVSVGFVPKDFEIAEARGPMAIDFKRQELLEFSAVPVPANPEALVQLGATDAKPLYEWAVRCLDGEGELIVPRKMVEDAHSALKGVLGDAVTVQVPEQRELDLTPPEPEPEPEPEPAPEPPDIVDVAAASIDELELEVKGGRVLSGANEGKLREAQAKIEQVLASQGSQADGDDEKDYIEIEDDDAEELAEMVRTAVRAQFENIGAE